MIKPGIKENYIGTALIIISFFILYKTTILKLVEEWSVNPNFSHGFLIPLISLYMIFLIREELGKRTIKPSKTGLFILLAGLGFYVVGSLGAEFFIMRSSMLVVIAGVVGFNFGLEILKDAAAPIAYLFLMVPFPAIIWNKLAFPLKLFSAARASEIIIMLGIPVLREGNIIHLANTSLEVVDACSGLRSLTSLLAISGAFAFITPLKRISRIFLFLSAIPGAVVLNVGRLTATALMAIYIGPETAHGFLHELSGFVVFGAGLILIYMNYFIISFIENKISQKGLFGKK